MSIIIMRTAATTARASLFTEDAEFEMATRTARTRKGIEEYVASIWPPGGRWLFRRRRIASDLDPDETGASVHGMKP